MSMNTYMEGKAEGSIIDSFIESFFLRNMATRCYNKKGTFSKYFFFSEPRFGNLAMFSKT